VEFDKLVANRPKQMEQMAKEIDDLRATNDGEMKLAESKVRAMLESKKSVVEGASAQLLKLRNDTSNIERELDEARKKKLLQPVIDHKESDDNRANDGEEAREDTSKPKVGKTRIQKSITRISKSLSKR
jgi:transglutaminase/protease-like cytokinesis protein 3